MKRIFLLLWLLPVLAYSQLTVTGGSSLDLDTLLPIIADSTDWTDGSTVHAIKPKAGKTVEADSVKAGALEVTGNARFNSNVTMVTTAGEQVQLGTGSDAAPELSSAGDTNTGIRFPGSNITTFVQGGVERARITGLGGLNLSSAPSDSALGKLNVTGSTTDNLLNIKQTQAELITAQVDRDFSGAGNWTGTNWAVSGGTLLHTAGNTTAATLAYTNFTASSILAGYPYELVFTVSGLTAGTVTPKLGAYTATAVSANGTYSIVINASGDNVNLTFTPTSTFDGALDNISMKLVENAQYVKGGILYHSGIQSVGGNARGIGATDLQVFRTAPTQVASGNYSTVSGYTSTASGHYSTASGLRSIASGSYSTASGSASIASGSYSTASGDASTASGSASTASGSASTASQYGSRAHAAGRFAANGDAQFSAFVLRDTTLSSQSDTLKLDGTEAATTGYLTIAANQALYFEGRVIAWCVSGTKDNMAAAYKIEGLIQRDGSNNTTLVWSAVTDKYEHADLAAALSVTLSANDTKECLNIICAGMYEQTIYWVATIDAVQVGG